jgi:hypothetical protein
MDNVVRDLQYKIQFLELEKTFVVQSYKLQIEQNQQVYDLHMAQKKKEMDSLQIKLSSSMAEVDKLKIELSSSVAEIDKLKTEVSSVESITLSTDATPKEKEELRKLIEKLVTWDYHKLIINAEDIVEDIFLILHTNALESSYLDLQTEVEVLQRKVRSQKLLIKRLKQSQILTKTEQITEHANSKSTATMCNVKPSPFAVVMK